MEEILHQLVGSLSHSLQGFIHPKWCRISGINGMFKVDSKGSQTIKWHTQNQSRKGRRSEETSRQWPRHDSEELGYIDIYILYIIKLNTYIYTYIYMSWYVMYVGKHPPEWHQSVVQAWSFKSSRPLHLWSLVPKKKHRQICGLPAASHLRLRHPCQSNNIWLRDIGSFCTSNPMQWVYLPCSHMFKEWNDEILWDVHTQMPSW